MKLTTQQLSAALDTIASNISEAANEFDEALEGDPMAKENCAWDLELVYAQLLTLAEALNLPQLRSTIQTDFDAARAHLLAERLSGSTALPLSMLNHSGRNSCRSCSLRPARS